MTAFLAVGCAVAVTLICAALFTPGSAQGISSNRQTNDISTIDTCGENQFRCRNGDCIQNELLCDGRADCSDQSDETQAECTKPELTCPDYTFRCTYGACVNGDAACNGVRDCIDNSDETLSRCPGISAADPDEGCGPDDYPCRDGQCIASTSLCDGTVDCSDGSDETYVNCGSFSCSQLVFRCNYGACIDGDLTCNNVSNCADGSDEDPLLCGHPGPRPPTERPPTPTPTPTPKPTPSPTPSPTPPRTLDCVVPPQPEHGHWKLHRSLCGAGSEIDCDIPQGTALEPGSILVYECESGYKIRGNPKVYCERGRATWSSNPVCIPIKCSVLDPVSTMPTCTTPLNEYTSCLSPVPPGTRATVHCRSGYRRDTNSITVRSEHVLCNRNGKWEPEPIKCVPVCGKAITHQTPLVVHGTAANIGDFPWHATIYQETNTPEGPKKEFLCGATIIQSNLVLTAAHCVYNERTRTTTDPNKLFIMTGNTFRNYDSPAHNPIFVRRSPVKNVHRYCQYYGLTGNYAADIALLELKEPFPLSDTLLPACLDFDGNNAQLLDKGSFGKVAGFGRTATGPSSGILQTLTLPYVSYNECKNASGDLQTEAFIGVDKFCAGYNNGSAVCEGDSGGGLVFKKFEQWYVLGIVSVSLGVSIESGEARCNQNSYSLYTRVSNYLAWIQQIIFDLERYNSYLATCDNNVPSRGNF